MLPPVKYDYDIHLIFFCISAVCFLTRILKILFQNKPSYSMYYRTEQNLSISESNSYRCNHLRKRIF